MKIYFLSIFLLLVSATITIAHGDKKYKKDSTTSQNDTIDQERARVKGDTVRHHDEGMKHDESVVTADFGDFPTLHPLIVHFAIVLIMVAAALQLLNAILLKKELTWIITAILLIGFLAAWFASRNFHPHTHGLNEHAKLVLEQHDKFAGWTINTAMAGLALQILYLFALLFSKRMKTAREGTHRFASMLNRIAAAVIALVLLSSAYFVARTGHYGSQLAYIEGIGPQGKFLEMEHHH